MSGSVDDPFATKLFIEISPSGTKVALPRTQVSLFAPKLLHGAPLHLWEPKSYHRTSKLPYYTLFCSRYAPSGTEFALLGTKLACLGTKVALLSTKSCGFWYQSCVVRHQSWCCHVRHKKLFVTQ
jgi:hypothetical protein